MNWFKRWLLREVHDELRDISINQDTVRLRQEIIATKQLDSMKELWLKLAQWWQQEYINIKPPTEWPVVGEMGIVQCPGCGTSYDMRKFLPVDASQATVVCVTPTCGEMFEIYPDGYYGWLKARVEKREKSFA